MSRQTFSREGVVSFHDRPEGAAGNAARGLVIGLGISQVFWMGLAYLIFR